MKDTFLSNIVNLPRDIGEKLQKDIPTLVFGKNLFLDTIDTTPNDCIAIFEAPGGKFNPLAGASRRTLILQARSLTSAAARASLWGVFRNLNVSEDNLIVLNNGAHPFTFADTPHKVGKDEKGRITFQFTMYIIYHN